MKLNPYLCIVFLLISSIVGAQTKKDSVKVKPIVFINGKPVSDTVRLSDFERIDYIKGKQAMDLMGPRGKNGIYLVSSDGKIPVYGTVKNLKGANVNRAKILSAKGELLATTNKCGTFFISSFKLYERIIIQKKGFEEMLADVNQTEINIQLKKRKK